MTSKKYGRRSCCKSHGTYDYGSRGEATLSIEIPGPSFESLQESLKLIVADLARNLFAPAYQDYLEQITPNGETDE